MCSRTRKARGCLTSRPQVGGVLGAHASPALLQQLQLPHAQAAPPPTCPLTTPTHADMLCCDESLMAVSCERSDHLDHPAPAPQGEAGRPSPLRALRMHMWVRGWRVVCDPPPHRPRCTPAGPPAPAVVAPLPSPPTLSRSLLEELAEANAVVGGLPLPGGQCVRACEFAPPTPSLALTRHTREHARSAQCPPPHTLSPPPPPPRACADGLRFVPVDPTCKVCVCVCVCVCMCHCVASGVPCALHARRAPPTPTPSTHTNTTHPLTPTPPTHSPQHHPPTRRQVLPVTTVFQVPAVAVALGASYFQRLLLQNPSVGGWVGLGVSECAVVCWGGVGWGGRVRGRAAEPPARPLALRPPHTLCARCTRPPLPTATFCTTQTAPL